MSYISDTLREMVIKRANSQCEYCLIHQRDSLYAHEVDHIIAEKHRGETVLDNLCLSCLPCNRHKGTDFASFDLETAQVSLLFNPRTDIWTNHFRLDGALIVPVTAQGRVTEFILQLNNETRLRERKALLVIGRYPPPDNYS